MLSSLPAMPSAPGLAREVAQLRGRARIATRSKAARPRHLPRATGEGRPREEATIPERLGADAQYSKLNELLVQSQLVSRLSDGQSWTLFAFSNAALERTMAALGLQMATLLANKDLLMSIMARHLVPSAVPGAQLRPGTDLRTLAGSRVRVTQKGDLLRVGGAQVKVVDIPARRGVIHVVDDVLLPPDLSATRYARTLPGMVRGVFFDPLQVTKNQTRNEIQRLREAEVTHARVAMAACAGILAQENWSPLMPDAVNPAIIHWQQLGTPAWQLCFGFIAAVEVARARTGWVPPVEGLFLLREEYIPGNLGFDPLGLRFIFKDGLDGARDAELQWGRLAMLASVVLVLEEAVTGQRALTALRMWHTGAV